MTQAPVTSELLPWERAGTYASRVSGEGEPPDHHAWAISVERGEDGTTVFRDERDEPLVALAVDRDDLTRLESGLRALAQDDATAALLDRLATLRADLDESG